jgi:hypothetical protein
MSYIGIAYTNKREMLITTSSGIRDDSKAKFYSYINPTRNSFYVIWEDGLSSLFTYKDGDLTETSIGRRRKVWYSLPAHSNGMVC